MQSSLTMKVSDYLWEGRWKIPDYFLQKDDSLHNQIVNMELPLIPASDKLNWTASTGGNLTNMRAYLHLKGNFPKLSWCKIIWKKCIPLSRSFIIWIWAHHRLPTYENLQKRGCILASVCSFCMNQSKTSSHLFLNGPMSLKNWSWLPPSDIHSLKLTYYPQIHKP